MDAKHQQIMKGKIKENGEKILNEQKELLKSELDKLNKVCKEI